MVVHQFHTKTLFIRSDCQNSLARVCQCCYHKSRGPLIEYAVPGDVLISQEKAIYISTHSYTVFYSVSKLHLSLIAPK